MKEEKKRGTQMLKLENVSKFYYNKGIIASGFTKVNLELKIGEFVVITGESGSGKSTLLNVISGLDSYEEGEMYVNGQETSHYTEKDFEDYRRKYVANIFQSFNLVNSYTVYQNVELVLLLNGYKKRDIKAKVLDMIEQVGLTEFKNTKVSKLSGGQKQRVAIARAMVKETPIIVADEPTGNLDSESAKEVIQILKKVAKDKLVVVVTHNIEQVEEYATRVIKMHDGRIIENMQRKEIAEEPKAEESAYNNISLANKYRLGIRNTFNIVTKFCLLFAVFFFMSSAVLAEYASFQMSKEASEKIGYSMVFHNIAENRIIINKKDRSPFTSEDYTKIKALANVDYVVEDDILIDSVVPVQKGDITFFCCILDIESLKGDLTYGRMPENENEIVLQTTTDNFYMLERLDEVLNKTFKITDSQRNSYSSDDATLREVVIVGIQTKESNYGNGTIYTSKEILQEVRKSINKQYGTMKIFMNNKYMQYTVTPTSTVAKGKAVVDDEWKYQFKNFKIKNQPLTISVNNIYYQEEVNLTIENTFTKNNFKRMTGQNSYATSRNTVFINTEDYDTLYNKPSYQSSIYVKDKKMMDETMAELESLGMNPKKVTDFAVKDSQDTARIVDIIKVIVTIVLLIVLFFISYLIIRIILKSRNVYYTTLRMLGATYKNVRRILDIELFANATIAYIALMCFLTLVHNRIIPLDMIANLTNFLHLPEYIGMYVILIGISRLISIKFAGKLFKKSAISTYNEEV